MTTASHVRPFATEIPRAMASRTTVAIRPQGIFMRSSTPNVLPLGGHSRTLAQATNLDSRPVMSTVSTACGNEAAAE